MFKELERVEPSKPKLQDVFIILLFSPFILFSLFKAKTPVSEHIRDWLLSMEFHNIIDYDVKDGDTVEY